MVSFDTVISKSKNTIQVVFSVDETDLPYELEDFCSIIYYHILRKHKMYVECVYVFKKETLKTFFNECRPARFRLRDVIHAQNINGLNSS